MELIVFSDKKNIEQCFEKITKVRGCSVGFFPVKDFLARTKTLCADNLVYIDISSVKEAERKKYLNRIFKSCHLRTGIIDPDGSVINVAELFHCGVVDYIGKNFYKEGLTLKHVESVFNFRCSDFEVQQPEAVRSTVKNEKYIFSGKDWSGVKPGKEYTFCFMFIELDNFREMKKTVGADRAKKIMDGFHSFIGNYMSQIHGRIWMWMDYTGLILLPFDGERCDAILYAFKLMLNRSLINSIDLPMDYSYSYHIALHIGNTVYRERGDTGTIVSDSINSVFHLGQKYAEKQTLYLTEDLVRFIPDGLRDLFVSAGEFEGREITRMKRLV